MSETPSGRSTSTELGAAPGVGVILSAVALAGLAVPVRRGVEDPVVWTGAAFALIALVAFLARRHGGLERRWGAPIAAVSSFGVVLLSGYAMNQGITAAIDVPLSSGGFPLAFAAFVAAGAGVGVGVADYVGLTNDGLRRRTVVTAGLSLLGALGLVGAFVATQVIAIPAFFVLGEFTTPQAVALSQLGFAVGTASVAVLYLVFKDYAFSFIDLRVPSIRDALWTVAGLIVLFGALFAMSMLFSSAGVESADHGTAQQAQQNPDILLVLIPASILIIGPFEELLYRNVIQKSLYEVFSRAGAIVVASVIFAAVHVLAYSTAGLGAVVASLGIIFGLSLVLGTIYERTDNLLVPAIVHGVYNAILFTSLYFSVV